jgi:uncharacterized protein YecT (DUF1311 family)
VKFFAAALTVCAMSAAAQDIPFSIDATQLCLNQTKGDKRACVGLSADKCLATDFGMSTYGMVTCVGQEIEFWQEQLSQNYQSGLRRSNEWDSELASLGMSPVNQAQTLVKAMDHFMQYRENVCAYQANVYAGGTIMGPIISSCYLDMTAEFALTLAGTWND